MKLRNQLLALVCLLVFIAFGFIFFRTWVVQKPFGVILFISDGLTTNTLTATRLYQGGAQHQLALESFPQLALVSNYANDFAVPDSAAAATALATGVKGNNQAIGLDSTKKELRSILTLASESGRSTGIVTTGNLTDATPAAFYAHSKDPSDVSAIAQQFVNNSKVNIALGGGLADFTPENKGGHRKDGRDLWLDLRGKGTFLLRTKAELENTPGFLTGPLVGLFSEGNLPFSSQIQSGSQQPTLSDMVRRSIEFLQTNRRGYFLVVDAALISRAAEQNEGEAVLKEMIDFDNALATAVRYAGEKTLIIAVGKHDVGGLTLNGYPLRGDHGVALLGKNAAGFPAITWSTGPNGPKAPAAEEPLATPTPATESGDALKSGSANALSGTATSLGQTSSNPAAANEPPQIPPTPQTVAQAASEPSSEPAAFASDKAINTARDVVAIGMGPGSENLGGFMDNTEIFKLLKKSL
jgi:alkaline phosphatase